MDLFSKWLHNFQQLFVGSGFVSNMKAFIFELHPL